jgi:hypothetical protein
MSTKKAGKKTKAADIPPPPTGEAAAEWLAANARPSSHYDAPPTYEVKLSDRESAESLLRFLADMAQYEQRSEQERAEFLAKLAEVRASLRDKNAADIRRAMDLMHLFYRPMAGRALAANIDNFIKSQDSAARRVALRAAYEATPQPRKREPWCRDHFAEHGFDSWRTAYDQLEGL